ncbi:toxin-activating lysine-acyltransferase [Massilia violaceinigra]|uniref:RTX toxin-activating lysine-acyltransferase n=1 Tax=Massilia violaceinigra TaxID=2045208 RepID=A0ABY3ZZ24_9BURK|nr:toxin-activating lysine-acyltransferase [Massilia violaceinigra]UOD27367.1 toxin-activating lysine-acyltransferase [Massilia violaceinigra]
MAMLMGRSVAHQKQAQGFLSNVLSHALLQKTVKVYFDCDGNPVGYVVWAFIDHATEQRIIRTGDVYLDRAEWNEGESLWIMDLAAPNGNIKYILQDLRDRVFKDEHRLRYFRLKGGRKIFKELSRASPSYFFRVPQEQAGICDCGDPACSGVR